MSFFLVGGGWKKIINWSIFILIGFCFVFSIINQAKVVGVFYAAIVLAIIYQLIFRVRYVSSVIWVPAAMVFWAATRWAWLLWQGYPHHTYAENAYNAYWHCSKYLFWGAPLLLYAFSAKDGMSPDRRRQFAAVVFYGTDLVAILLALKLSIIDHMERIVYYEQVATLSAYMMCVVHFLAINHFLSHGPRRSTPLVYLLLFSAVVLQFYALVLTGTRSAMIVYVLMLPGLLLSYYRSYWRQLACAGIVFIVVVWGGFGQLISTRVNQFQSDISMYHRSTEVTSIGARLSMWSAAWYVLQVRPFGGPIEQRHQLISNAVHAGKLDPQVLSFIDIHLHNDWVEITTLMGVGGALLLLAWYGALFALALKRRGVAGRGIMIVAASSLGFGMTDTLYLWGWYLTFLMVALVFVALAYPDERMQTDELPTRSPQDSVLIPSSVVQTKNR